MAPTMVKVFYFVADLQGQICRAEVDPDVDVYDLLRKIRDDIASWNLGWCHATQWNWEFYKVNKELFKMDLSAVAGYYIRKLPEGRKEFKNLPVVEKVADFLNNGKALLYVVVSDIRRIWNAGG